MLIGERAGSVSLPPRTIRYDEEVGLLPPPERRPNGYRRYDESAGERADLRRLASRGRAVPRRDGSYCHLIEHASA